MADYSTTTYSVPFSNFPVSSTGGAAAFDLWSIKASPQSRVEIDEIRIGQASSAVAGNQQLAVQVMRGSTALGGGSAVTPANLKGWPASAVALTSASAPSSNLASTASAVLLLAGALDVSGAWCYRPQPGELVLDKSQALHVRVSALPLTALLSGMLVLREVGKP